MKAKNLRKSILIIVCIASSSLISSCGVNTRGWKDLVTTGFNLNETDIPLSIDIHAKDERNLYSDEEECFLSFTDEEPVEIVWNEIKQLLYNPSKSSKLIDDYNEWYVFTINLYDISYDFTVYRASYYNCLVTYKNEKHEVFAGGLWGYILDDLRKAGYIEYKK